MNEEGFPLIDEDDLLIIAHRDAHFSGSFSAMREYYTNPEAKGVVDETWLSRIDVLESLAQHYDVRELLPEDLWEIVMQSRAMYEQLHKAAEEEHNPLAQAMLSEEDVDVTTLNIEPHVAMMLVQSELFANPLFPGYGHAPIMAIKLLGHLRYEPAIELLLSCIGSDFEKESAALAALYEIGPRVKEWAIRQLRSSVIAKETERAVLVALTFVPDPEIEEVLRTRVAHFPEIVQQYVRNVVDFPGFSESV